MKRQLNDDEKKLSQKNLKIMEEEIEHLKFLLEYNTLMVEKGLESNFKEKLREYKKSLKMLEGDIKEKTNSVCILSDQIKNGVVIKEKKKPTGVG